MIPAQDHVTLEQDHVTPAQDHVTTEHNIDSCTSSEQDHVIIEQASAVSQDDHMISHNLHQQQTLVERVPVTSVQDKVTLEEEDHVSQYNVDT